MYQDKKKPFATQGFYGFSALFSCNEKFTPKTSKMSPKMSPKCRTPQTLVALRFKALFLDLALALKRGS